jgi:hypothetical protein
VALDKPHWPSSDSPATLTGSGQYIPPLLPGFFPRAAGSFETLMRPSCSRILQEKAQKA